MSDLRGGIDLGGTKIQTAVIDAEGAVKGEARRPTPTEGGPADVAEAMAEALFEAAKAAGVESAELQGVGVGSPGDADEKTGVVSGARNLPGWDGSFRAALSADPRLRLVYSGPDAAVYQARLPASTPRATAGSVLAAPARSTVWSPVGIAAFVLAVLLLGSREFIRECVPSRRWLLRPLWIASVPAVLLLLGAVAVRFAVLG